VADFKQFVGAGGTPVFVNPETVAYLKEANIAGQTQSSVTTIVFVGHGDHPDPVNVSGTPEAIAQALAGHRVDSH
jgi:hypothetical protein